MTITKLPSLENIETQKVLKKVISANRALAELKGVARINIKLFRQEHIYNYNHHPLVF